MGSEMCIRDSIDLQSNSRSHKETYGLVKLHTRSVVTLELSDVHEDVAFVHVER